MVGMFISGDGVGGCLRYMCIRSSLGYFLGNLSPFLCVPSTFTAERTLVSAFGFKQATAPNQWRWNEGIPKLDSTTVWDVMQKLNDVSKERTASIFKVKG
jgi:hypothetical protein